MRIWYRVHGEGGVARGENEIVRRYIFSEIQNKT